MIIVDQNVSGGSVQHQWKVGAKGKCKKNPLAKNILNCEIQTDRFNV